MSLRTLTFALLLPGLRPEDLAPLAASDSRAAREALVDLVWRGPSATLSIAALRALGRHDHPLSREVVRDALQAPQPGLRRAAVASLCALGHDADTPPLLDRLAVDPAWSLRADVIRLLDAPRRWGLLVAADDPHWRVRYALSEALLGWDVPTAELAAHAPDDPRARGLLRFLARMRGEAPAPLPPPPDDPLSAAPWWDPDPPAVGARLSGLDKRALRAELPWMVHLLGHEDASARRVAVHSLRRWADTARLADAVRRLAEPRAPFVADSLDRLLPHLDLDQREAVSRALLASAEEPPAALRWALAQVGTAYPLEPADRAMLQAALNLVRRDDLGAAAIAAVCRSGVPAEQLVDTLRPALAHPALAPATLRGLGTWLPVDALAPHRLPDTPAVRRAWAALLPRRTDLPDDWLEAATRDPDPVVRAHAADARARLGQLPTSHPLHDDDDLRVRAAAMTPARAEQLWQNPDAETSWRVLGRAAQVLGHPLTALAARLPPRITPPDPLPETALAPTLGDAPRRRLGPDGPEVSLLGLSGHYGLEEAGYARGLEAGINLFFWEPDYSPMTRFLRGLPPALKRQVVVVTGTYDAGPDAARRDLDRAMRALDLPQLGAFLVFWARSPSRLDDATRAVLEEARLQGALATWGLSTHARALAEDSMTRGLPLIMLRHNGAHRGAEQALFPLAEQQGIPVLSFSALCYGRMLRRPTPAAPAPPTAADCYRYSLMQPAVRATWSAPKDLGELEQNLAVLKDPTLPPERADALRAFGDHVYARNRAFAEDVRWR
ncbi:MAG: HEAT repeat domain-containing protein [Alphaproteobacteria bacterium]|nr:HEAT repeat domain-containing protein [Alphaproteobacteria bacterium]